MGEQRAHSWGACEMRKESGELEGAGRLEWERSP